VASTEKPLGRAMVLGPDEGKSYWQPVPANGFARNLFNDAITGSVHALPSDVCANPLYLCAFPSDQRAKDCA